MKRLLNRMARIPWIIKFFTNWEEIILETLKGNFPSRVKTRNGLIIYGNKKFVNLISLIYDIFEQRIYTPKFFKINNEDIIVDIGSNVGLFSIYASQFTNNKIYAYEPFPPTFQLLKKNIIVNDLDKKIIIRSIGISDEEKIKRIYIGDIWASNTTFNDRINPKKFVNINTIKFPKIFEDNHLDHIDFLKIDCEGCEEYIIMNFTKDECNKIKKIAMEYHDNFTSNNHITYIKKLKELGYCAKYSKPNTNGLGYIYA